MPDNSFDVVSQIEMPEVNNAVQQALKEVHQRYDLKDSHSNIELKEKENKILLHSSDDHVTPVEQSIELFRHAGQPTELHLFADTDHFMFAEGNTRVHRVVQDWLANYFAVEAKAKAA